ncbi:MAG TPA: AarF/UbiB family protein [Acidimicrobiales bacterium]|nr:AarF/UbiB family protein [Acidimicrobiales bacterium]
MSTLTAQAPRPAPTADPVVEGIDLRKLSPADATRMVEIVLTFARHGALVVARRGPFLVIRPRRRAPRALAVAARRSFVDLGPTFVKLGQLIASSPGLFPGTLSEEMRRLLDSVPPEPAHRVRRIIRKELGAPVSELFERFDDRPVAAASIAQVHRAWLRDGTSVAVKVRRPRLSGRIERDLRLLRLLALVIEQAGAVGEMANPVAIVDDFAVTLRAELDFRNEAGWMVDFERNLRSFGDNDRVLAPTPVPDMVSRRVLVMSFVEGRPVDDVIRGGGATHDLEELLIASIRAWAEGALVHGLFHGDVHAGNLFVTPEGRVVFLDFGIMGRLEDRVRRAVLDALPPILLAQDWAAAARLVVELAETSRPIDAQALARDIGEMATPVMAVRLADVSLGEVLSKVIAAGTRHKLRLPRELVLVAKQMLYFERYAKAMAPDYQLLADPRIMATIVPGIVSREQ